MASKRRLRRRSCEGKKSYATKQIANAVCRKIMAITKGVTKLHSYACEFSGHWHIGHRPKPKFNKIQMASKGTDRYR